MTNSYVYIAAHRAITNYKGGVEMSIFRNDHIERNPAQHNFACPRATAANKDTTAPQPLSACKDCPHLSFANCSAPDVYVSVNNL